MLSFKRVCLSNQLSQGVMSVFFIFRPKQRNRNREEINKDKNVGMVFRLECFCPSYQLSFKSRGDQAGFNERLLGTEGSDYHQGHYTASGKASSKLLRKPCQLGVYLGAEVCEITRPTV